MFRQHNSLAPRRFIGAGPGSGGHVRSAKYGILLGSLLVTGALAAVATPAQESDAPETQTQTADEREEGQKQDTGSEKENEMEGTDEAEEPSSVKDIIPSEMISEDLAVDFPIDI